MVSTDVLPHCLDCGGLGAKVAVTDGIQKHTCIESASEALSMNLAVPMKTNSTGERMWLMKVKGSLRLSSEAIFHMSRSTFPMSSLKTTEGAVSL